MTAAPAQARRPAPEVLELSAPQLHPPGAPHGSGRWLGFSFAACVILPVLAALLYFGTVATDRFVSGAGFAVRGVDGGPPLDGFGALTGIVSAGSTTSDSYIVLNYLQSRDLVERLDGAIPLRAAFGDPGIDLLSRADPQASIEELVEYWRRRVSTRYDTASGILAFEVEAFTPDDALRIAGLVLDATHALVNGLSDQARQDAVQFAEAEVARAEARLVQALGRLRDFREAEHSIDPATTAELDLELLAETEARLVEIETRLAALSGRLAATAPTMIRLRREAEAVRAQLARMTATRGEPAGLASQLAAYEALEVEKSFAEQSYASALTSLEQARIEANRQQRYLAVYSMPARPEDPLYPRRAVNILVVAAAALAIWSIGTLVVYAVRDHVG